MSGANLRRRPAFQTGAAMAIRRTTMRSRSGTKLYAVRDEQRQVQGHPDLQARARRRPAPQVESREGGRAGPDREEGQEGGQRCRQVRQAFGEGRGRGGGTGGQASGEEGFESASDGNAALGKEDREESRREIDPQARGEEDGEEGREEDRAEAGGEKNREEIGEEEVAPPDPLRSPAPPVLRGRRRARG